MSGRDCVWVSLGADLADLEKNEIYVLENIRISLVSLSLSPRLACMGKQIVNDYKYHV